MKALGEAGDAQKALAELVPKDAHVVLEDDSIETRPVSELQIGDVIRVQAGKMFQLMVSLSAENPV